MASLSSTLISFLERVLPEKWVKRYEILVYSAGINFLAVEYLVISILLGFIFGIAVFLFFSYYYSILTFAGVTLVMAFGYPYWKIARRTEQMEKMLPDAFFYLASSLRAGISFSEALEELSTAKFGVLTEEFKRTVSEIKKGRPTVDALRAFALRNNRSPILYRSIMIIIEALERGAPMSDVLVFVANDVREILRIRQERKASTGMQTMFFILISGFVGPLIMGIVAKVLGTISMGSFGGNMGEVVFSPSEIQTVLLGFIVLQGFVSGLGIGVIREGKYSAGLKYGIMLVLMGIVTYKLAVSANLSF